MDMAVRFCLSTHSVSVVFNTILDRMYYKFGQISILPHSDQIISQMPATFQKNLPSVLAIIDRIKFKTQTPSALGLQSQLFEGQSYSFQTVLNTS